MEKFLKTNKQTNWKENNYFWINHKARCSREKRFFDVYIPRWFNISPAVNRRQSSFRQPHFLHCWPPSSLFTKKSKLCQWTRAILNSTKILAVHQAKPGIYALLFTSDSECSERFPNNSDQTGKIYHYLVRNWKLPICYYFIMLTYSRVSPLQ